MSMPVTVEAGEVEASDTLSNGTPAGNCCVGGPGKADGRCDGVDGGAGPGAGMGICVESGWVIMVSLTQEVVKEYKIP